MKNKFLYIFLCLLFIATILSIVITYLNIHYDKNGDVIFNNNYYDIEFNNVINDNENVSVKVEDNSILLELNNDEKILNSLYIDTINIGNEDAVVDNVDIKKINCGDGINSINVELSLLDGDSIEGGMYKKLKIVVSNNELIKDGINCNININYVFNSLKK